MIVTLTPNPSIDTTLTLDEELTRGAVQRLSSVTAVAGGKGINVAHAVMLAGIKTTAVFPASPSDPFLSLVDDIGLAQTPVDMDHAVRTNTTVTEPDGTTTKLNGPGSPLSAEVVAAVEKQLVDALDTDTDWVVLAGSLPPGAPADWYSRLVSLVNDAKPAIKIAVDTSDAALVALGEKLETSAPTLIKPNGLELGQLVGVDGLELENRAEEGEYGPIIDAARALVGRGIPEILVTLGAAGAALVTSDAAWVASSPKIKAVSTVGAGDSSLAGYVMARSRGLELPECLIQAVSYGSAAAALPGTTIPSPDEVTTTGAEITQTHQF